MKRILFLLMLFFIGNASGIVYDGDFSQTDKPREYYVQGFSYLLPLNTTITDKAVFETNFINAGNESIRVNYIKISGIDPSDLNCTVLTSLPVIVPVGGVIPLETNECIIINNIQNFVRVSIEIQYNIISEDGAVINKNGTDSNETSRGIIQIIFRFYSGDGKTVRPLDTMVRSWYKINEKGELISIPQSYNPVIFDIGAAFPRVFVIWILSFIFRKKNKLIDYVFILSSLFLILMVFLVLADNLYSWEKARLGTLSLG